MAGQNAAAAQDPSIFELTAICATEEAALQFCREEGLIPKPPGDSAESGSGQQIRELWGVCSEIGFNPAVPDCKGNVTTVMNVSKNGPKPQYRCIKCRKKLSQQHGLLPVGGTVKETLFAGLDKSGRPNSKVPKRAVIWILYALAKDIGLQHTISLVRGSIGLTSNTVINWRNCFRAVMLEALECAPRMGGPGELVQVGECLFRGSRVRRRSSAPDWEPSGDGPWVFGLVHEATGELRLYWVEDTDAATVLPVIVSNVAPGTTICSDERASYSRGIKYCLDSPDSGGGAMNYRHRLEAGVPQLTMKFRTCKTKLLHQNKGTTPALLPGHLSAFWWNSLHGPDKCHDPFLRLLGLIRERYPQV